MNASSNVVGNTGVTQADIATKKGSDGMTMSVKKTEYHATTIRKAKMTSRSTTRAGRARQKIAHIPKLAHAR